MGSPTPHQQNGSDNSNGLTKRKIVTRQMFRRLPKSMAISRRRRRLTFLNAHFRCFIVWGGEFEWPKIASKKRHKYSKWGQETSKFCHGDNLHRS